jgi:succinate dehydrogenase / fumarate reductase flavoprotein subunit
VQALPIDRLRQMNPLSIELYLRYKVDIRQAPLEFAVNHQHMNGGIAVDTWGRSNLGGLYAIGEAAGTHGVTRPGGAALNAGQVMGTRVAEHIAAKGVTAPDAPVDAPLAEAVTRIEAVLKADSPLAPRAIREAVQARMSDAAGILCTPAEVAAALQAATDLNRMIRQNGISFARGSEIARVLQWQQMALASEAVLAALDHYISNGGGSRGARAICDPAGEAIPMAKTGPLHEVRFRTERDIDKGEQILVRMDGEDFVVSQRRNRTFDENAKAFFERDWPAWLAGAVYDLESGR